MLGHHKRKIIIGLVVILLLSISIYKIYFYWKEQQLNTLTLKNTLLQSKGRPYCDSGLDPLDGSNLAGYADNILITKEIFNQSVTKDKANIYLTNLYGGGKAIELTSPIENLIYDDLHNNVDDNGIKAKNYIIIDNQADYDRSMDFLGFLIKLDKNISYKDLLGTHEEDILYMKLPIDDMLVFSPCGMYPDDGTGSIEIKRDKDINTVKVAIEIEPYYFIRGALGEVRLKDYNKVIKDINDSKWVPFWMSQEFDPDHPGEPPGWYGVYEPWGEDILNIETISLNYMYISGMYDKEGLQNQGQLIPFYLLCGTRTYVNPEDNKRFGGQDNGEFCGGMEAIDYESYGIK